VESEWPAADHGLEYPVLPVATEFGNGVKWPGFVTLVDDAFAGGGDFTWFLLGLFVGDSAGVFSAPGCVGALSVGVLFGFS